MIMSASAFAVIQTFKLLFIIGWRNSIQIFENFNCTYFISDVVN